jgi:hypothetical protein
MTATNVPAPGMANTRDSEHFLMSDDRFKNSMWEIKHMRSGPFRDQAIERF